MKREGHQHGMVRSYRILSDPLNPRPNTRFVTRFDSPPTAGLFTKVPSKPTNHSKFTGKCGTPRCVGCHLHPACKSKDKTKGTQKHKHSRLMDRPDSDFFGLSAASTLDHICSDYTDDEVEDVSINDQDDYHVNYSCTLDNGGDWAERVDDSKCISDQIDKDEEFNSVEDWCLVESCS